MISIKILDDKIKIMYNKTKVLFTINTRTATFIEIERESPYIKIGNWWLHYSNLTPYNKKKIYDPQADSEVYSIGDDFITGINKIWK